MSELSDKLGFYFVVFQRTLNGNYIKCWIDGNDDFEMYTQDELIDFCNILGIDTEVMFQLKKAFRETSIFLWDVEGRKVRRLSSVGGIPEKRIFDALKSKQSIKEGYVSYKDGVISVENGRGIK